MRSLELRLDDDAMDELEAVSARRKRDAALICVENALRISMDFST